MSKKGLHKAMVFGSKGLWEGGPNNLKIHWKHKGGIEGGEVEDSEECLQPTARPLWETLEERGYPGGIARRFLGFFDHALWPGGQKPLERNNLQGLKKTTVANRAQPWLKKGDLTVLQRTKTQTEPLKTNLATRFKSADQEKVHSGSRPESKKNVLKSAWTNVKPRVCQKGASPNDKPGGPPKWGGQVGNPTLFSKKVVNHRTPRAYGGEQLTE